MGQHFRSKTMPVNGQRGTPTDMSTTEASKKPRTGMKAHATTFDAYSIDPATIQIELGYNARDWADKSNQEHLADIKAKIRRNKFQRSGALTVRLDPEADVVYLVHGETRLKAVMELRAEGVLIPTVPCVAEEKATTPIQRKIANQEDNESKPFSLLEKGVNYAWFRAQNNTVAQIAESFGKSVAHIEEGLILADAPEALKAQIREGVISPSEALRQIRKHGPEAAVAHIEAAVARKTADQVPALALVDADVGVAAPPPSANGATNAAPVAATVAKKPSVKVTATDLATREDGPKLSRAKTKILVDALTKIVAGVKDAESAAAMARDALASAGLPVGEGGAG